MRIVVPLLLGAALAACGRESQPLPFSVDSAEPTVKTVSRSESATLSSVAGAAVRFPSGSFAGSTTVSLAPVAVPDAARRSGTALSGGFRLEPAGMELERPASVEIRFARPDGADGWLASVVNVTPDGVRELGGTRLDLRAGLAEAGIAELGTLAVVLPDPRAVVRVQGGGASRSLSAGTTSVLGAGTDSLVVDCGDAERRCEGLSATASESLMELVQDAAVVYPSVSGALRFAGASASGELRLSTSIRLLLESGASAENVEFHGLLRPTAGTVVTEDATAIVLTEVLVRVSGSSDDASGAHESIVTLVVPKGETGGSVTLSRTFEIRDAAGQAQDATVSLTFPVQLHP